MGLVREITGDTPQTISDAFKEFFNGQEFGLEMGFEFHDSFPDGDSRLEHAECDRPELKGKTVGSLVLSSRYSEWYLLKDGIFGSLPPSVGARIILAISSGLNCFCHCIAPENMQWEAERLWWHGESDESEAVADALYQLQLERPDATREDALLEHGIITAKSFSAAFPAHVLQPREFAGKDDAEWVEKLTLVQRFAELPNILQMTETLERMVKDCDQGVPKDNAAALHWHMLGTMHLTGRAGSSSFHLHTGRAGSSSFHLHGQDGTMLSHPIIIRWDEHDYTVKLTDELNELDQQTCSRMDICGLWPFDANDPTDIENTVKAMTDKIRCASVALKLLRMVAKQEDRHRT